MLNLIMERGFTEVKLLVGPGVCVRESITII